jgi:predicted DNA-binding protein
MKQNSVAPSKKTQMIRLDKAQAERLGALGAAIGASQAQLVRWAVEALIAKVEKSGGKITLPFDFELGQGESKTGSARSSRAPSPAKRRA